MAGELAATIGRGVVIFAATNVDDILVLALLFADRQLRARNVVIGQLLGIGVLVGASAAAAAAAIVIPQRWVALLGAIPLGLGVYKGVQAVRARDDDDDVPQLTAGSQVLAVAGITLANGGDNLGAYIPLFAVERGAIATYAAVFALMTALWCLVGFKLLATPRFGARLRRAAHLLLPLVLIALGLHLLAPLATRAPNARVSLAPLSLAPGLARPGPAIWSRPHAISGSGLDPNH